MMEITKLFVKKKQDLSSRSNDGHDSKGPRGSSLDNSFASTNNTDDVTEPLKSVDSVAILHSYMKKLEEEMKKAHQMCEKQNTVKLKAKSS